MEHYTLQLNQELVHKRKNNLKNVETLRITQPKLSNIHNWTSRFDYCLGLFNQESEEKRAEGCRNANLKF